MTQRTPVIEIGEIRAVIASVKSLKIYDMRAVYVVAALTVVAVVAFVILGLR